MKLSIVIPAYNEARTIARMLDLVRSVELIGGVTKQVIVVNDCSKDGTLEALHAYDDHADYPICRERFLWNPKLLPVLCFLWVIWFAFLMFLSWRYGIGLNGDPAVGILSLVRESEYFNTIEVVHDGVAELIFVTWFTPGQFYLPSLFSGVSGVSLGVSSILVVHCAFLVGIFGYFRLFRSYGASKEAAILTLIFISTKSLFSGAASTYIGGESIVFAAFPYLLYLIREEVCFDFKQTLFFLSIGLIAFFLKSSALIFVLSAGGAAVASRLFQQLLPIKFTLNRKHEVFWIVTSVGLIGLISFISFIRFSDSPGNFVKIELSLRDFLTPISSPIRGVSDIEAILNALFGSRILTEVICFALGAGVVLVAIKTLHVRVFSDLIRFVLFFWIFYSIVLFALHACNARIDESSRHTGSLNYLMTLLIVILFEQHIKKFREFLMIVGVVAAMGVGVRYGIVWGNLSSEGFLDTRSGFRLSLSEYIGRSLQKIDSDHKRNPCTLLAGPTFAILTPHCRLLPPPEDLAIGGRAFNKSYDCEKNNFFFVKYKYSLLTEDEVLESFPKCRLVTYYSDSTASIFKISRDR